MCSELRKSLADDHVRCGVDLTGAEDQVHLTDPGSRIMPAAGRGFEQSDGAGGGTVPRRCAGSGRAPAAPCRMASPASAERL